MEKTNVSVTEFFLLGLSQEPQLQTFLFISFLLMFLVTVIGNIFLMLAWAKDPRLQTPMYFFLVNLSFLDVCYSSAIVPNMLVQLVYKRTISFVACTTQMYIYIQLGLCECLILAAMAYDRYVAIVYPLRYTTIMSRPNCILMATSCWLSGSLLSFLDTFFTMRLFCGYNVINHFFCEATALLRVACLDTLVAEVVIISVGYTTLLIPCIFILITYIRIIVTIVRIRSSEARFKAFSTCAAHLIIVTIFYTTAMILYLKPPSEDTENQDKIISVFHTVTPPMLNPLIYSLRNKDVKLALKKLTRRQILSQ